MNEDMIERLKFACEAAGKSHWKVSVDAGFANTFLRDFYTGKKKSISSENIKALADQLNTSAGWLLEGSGDPPQSRAADAPTRLSTERARQSRGADYAKILGRIGAPKK